MHTQKELEKIRAQDIEQKVFNHRLMAMADSFNAWGTGNTPEREKLAFKDGFYEGFEAARKFFTDPEVAAHVAKKGGV